LRIYADSSFLVKLLARESASDDAVAEYRRLGRPCLFFVPLHALELENAIRQKAFHQRRSLPSGERGEVTRERNATLARLHRMLESRLFLEVAVDWDTVVRHARELSQKHTESSGARSLDLLHVAFALQLNCEIFLTTDHCQNRIAKAEGMEVTSLADLE
jgi:predicted nucleic acid-binding protein